MRLNALAALSAASTLLTTSTALPHQDTIAAPRTHDTSRRALDAPPNENAITLHLGTSARNVGTRVNDSLYNEIFSALRTVCPKHSAKGCAAAVGDKSVPRAKFQVFVAHGEYVLREDLYVYMQSAFWDARLDIYKLLTEAVAGVATRTTWSKNNCYLFWGYETKGEDVNYEMCNMLDTVNVGLAGGKYWMNVSFDSTRTEGEADCWSVREAAGEFLQRNVTGRLDKAMGWAEGTAWVVPECGV
ncbi:hypothetical protein CC86DRAFT_459987 [Ophiobolus disseminans]|uniref:Uncharacterized protein n=1 Tax=Ophiobolus disseminans TaxID=1469910 RepID=A0A6A6ZGY5_9PLEO|nr:hypothetical protein CC86DRAFT_459987 [Ophiobolus disseminans]